MACVKSLVKHHHAVEYYGQSKDDIKEAHLANRKLAVLRDETPNYCLMAPSTGTQGMRYSRMLVKFDFKPGINREGTQLTAGTGWYDGDKIRFRKGRAEQIGGWQKYSTNTFLGICRSLHGLGGGCFY